MKFKKALDPSFALNRRDILRLLSLSGALPYTLAPMGLLLADSAASQTQNPHRLLQIFLMGGWDGALSTDPAIGGKAAVNRYDRSYWDTGYSGYIGINATDVGGSINPDLTVGYGLIPMINAFRTVPTAFVNGMYVEVTAHELAVNYMYSGQLSLSRSREYPAFVATMADKTGGFPAHVLLGGPMPLGSTRDTNPPLQALDLNLLNMMMAGPKHKDGPDDIVFKESTLDAAHALIAKLNASFTARLGTASVDSLTAWKTAEKGLGPFYDKNFHSKMDITPLAGPYGFSPDDTGSIEAKAAGGFLAVKSGLSRFITVTLDGFDTHQNHTSMHVPLMRRVATAINKLVIDLAATPDTHPGAKSGDTLADNTTIVVLSDFNRTPIYNQQAGTDHWTTGNAILMGKGVKPNTVFGSTDNEGFALNQAGNIRIQTSTDSGVLLPNHLGAAIMRHFGFATQATVLTEEDITDALFF